MSRYWSRLVAKLDPYVPGEQPRIENLIKLNTNEHPYGPSPKVLQAIKAATNEGLRLYPDPTALSLRQVIAKRFGLTADHVFVGNGSDEVLAHTFLALLKHDAPVVFPDITYSFYPVYCGLYEIDFRTIPLNSAMQITTEDYLPANIGTVGGIIFPNPNAPTGCAQGIADIERVVVENPDVVVVVDEAYVDFGAQSAIELVDKYPNVLIIHTLSKSRSLAGLRVGYAVGNPVLIEALDRVKNSFNSYPIDRLAMAGAIAAFEDESYFQQSCALVIKTRTTMVEGLSKLGFVVLPSQANFVFAKHPKLAGEELASALRSKNILVRHFKRARVADYVRITVGTDEQTHQLLNVCAEILN